MQWVPAENIDLLQEQLKYCRKVLTYGMIAILLIGSWLLLTKVVSDWKRRR